MAFTLRAMACAILRLALCAGLVAATRHVSNKLEPEVGSDSSACFGYTVGETNL